MKRLLWIALIAVMAVLIEPSRHALLDSFETGWEWLGGPNGAETNSTTVRNVGLVVGGVVAIYLTMRRIRVASRQAHTAHKQWIAAYDSLRETEKSRFYAIDRDNEERRNSEYHKGAEMLASNEMFARIAGIHVLQDLAAGDPAGFGNQATALLTAFVMHPPRLDQESLRVKAEQRPDVQEARIALAAFVPGNDKERERAPLEGTGNSDRLYQHPIRNTPPIKTA